MGTTLLEGAEWAEGLNVSGETSDCKTAEGTGADTGVAVGYEANSAPRCIDVWRDEKSSCAVDTGEYGVEVNDIGRWGCCTWVCDIEGDCWRSSSESSRSRLFEGGLAAGMGSSPAALKSVSKSLWRCSQYLCLHHSGKIAPESPSNRPPRLCQLQQLRAVANILHVPRRIRRCA